MGLPWYGLWTNFPRHEKTRALCAALRDDNAGMYVIRLFSHCAEEALDGRVSAAAVEGIAEWKKRRGALLDALQAVGFLEPRPDGTCIVHGWEERNGARIRKALKDNARPNASRRGKAQAPPPPRDEGTRDPDRTPPLTPTKPRAGFSLGDGRWEKEKAEEEEARTARQVSAAEDVGGGSPPPVAASSAPESPPPQGPRALPRVPDFGRMDDDVCRPPPPVVDCSAQPEVDGASHELCGELRRQVALRTKRASVLDKVHDESWLTQLEAAIERVTFPRALAAALQAGAAWPGGHAAIQSFRFYGNAVLKLDRDGPAAELDPLEALRAKCSLWADVLGQLPEAARRSWLELAPAFNGQVLTLSAPTREHARMARDQAPHIAAEATKLQGHTVQVNVVEMPRSAAGGATCSA